MYQCSHTRSTDARDMSVRLWMSFTAHRTAKSKNQGKLVKHIPVSKKKHNQTSKKSQIQRYDETSEEDNVSEHSVEENGAHSRSPGSDNDIYESDNSDRQSPLPMDLMVGNWQPAKATLKQQQMENQASSRKMMDLDDFQLPASVGQDSQSQSQPKILNIPASPMSKTASNNLAKPTVAPPRSDTNPAVQSYPPMPQQNVTMYSEHQHQVAAVSQPSPQPQQSDFVVTETDVEEPLPEPDAFLLRQIRQKPLMYPFSSKYDHKLVCLNCYVKIAHGRDGYVLLNRHEHRCERNILLVKEQRNPQASWVMIRQRNTKVNYQGDYKSCYHFLSGQPCKVTEERCSFVHCEEEKLLWELDRANQIDIDEFIKEEARVMEIAEAKMKGNTANIQQLPVKTMSQNSQPPPNKYVNESVAPRAPRPPSPAPAPAPMAYNSVASRMPTPPPPVVLMNPPVVAPPIPRPPLLGIRPMQPALYSDQAQIRQVVVRQPQQKIQPLMSLSPAQNLGSVPAAQTNSHACHQEASEIAAFLKTHNHKLVCGTCIRATPQLGVYIVKILPHACERNILMMQRKGDTAWVRVRQRKGSHRQFRGQYNLCYHYCADIPRVCTVGEENCMFAHNLIEQQLWTLEKDGKLSLQEFVLKQRAVDAGSTQTISILEILKNYGGAFHFICRECFFTMSVISIESPINHKVCSTEHHIWQKNKMLINYGPNGITPISKRPFTHKEAFFRLCHKLQYCMRRLTSTCVFAHSFLERDVWILEREQDISREEIVQASKEFHLGVTSPPSDNQTAQPSPQQQQPQQGAAAKVTDQPLGGATVAPPVKCPYKVVFVCGLCWKQGLRNGKDPKNKERCVGKGSGHQWQVNRICLLLSQNKPCIIRALPQKIPAGNRFRMCEHLKQKRKCDYAGTRCQFAHSEDEIKVWTWQMQHNVKTLDDLVSVSEKSHATATTTIAKGQSVVAAKPVASKPRPAVSMPWALAVNAHYCHYCGIQCNSEKQWEGHCASDKHMFNVNSDKEHQWNFRQPPWGVSNGNYELCERHMRDGRCQYSNKPDMYNLCTFAHSRDELDEWRERWEWRSMKRSMAREEHMYSYMERVLEEYQQAESGFTVMAEELDDVAVSCVTPLSLGIKEKDCVQNWVFTVSPKSGQTLERVALVQNKDRLHFVLRHDDLDRTCQLASGDMFSCGGAPGGGKAHYVVEIQFTGGMFGSFMQWVVFDFGSRPLLVQKLNVEVTNEFVQQKVKHLREHLHFDRWTSDNREIVKFQNNKDSAKTFNSQMLQQYKSPSSAAAVITHDSVGVDLNRHNYVHKMHKLLQIEEITRHRIISNYNLTTDIELIHCIREESMIFARPGELFARVPLNDELSEDTDAGKLILTSVQHVLVAPTLTTTSKVYQAILVQKENFDYDGRGLNYIYLCLSSQMCQELNLQNDDVVAVEIQFQMDRLPFCLMHYSLEQLKNNDVVFPDVTKINPQWNEKRTLRLSSDVLNTDQMRIVEHIVAERVGYTPPLIIYGPFGTGKTETLAQATMVLVKERPDAKILICTHSNSAADLYILKHFDQFIQRGHSTMRVRRVYYEERRVTTVQSVVQKYCQLDARHSYFLPCSAEDIRQHQVVITTLSTSLVFSRLGLEGYFTHIFIDEGGQALECEAIMPFSLANDDTCIVLAGDHMQMSPKIYSREGRQQRFHRSLLERLFQYYDAYASHLRSTTLNILLSINYRSKMEIVRFISAIFYGGPNQLLANSNDVTVEGIKPLTFYTAQGREVQDSDSTSYYNIAEIDEVTDRVAELFDRWPAEWGEPCAAQIGVVTAYYDQVWKIRTSLRRRRKELRDVVVERVMNMQGREFRALFISTVRTRHLAENPPKLTSNVSECDGDVGDFGFLSDQKLLNTALTRAQSLVAVIGDPVALCSIGECVNIWRTFLKHCQNLGSLLPSTVTLESIKAQVIALVNSPHGENLIKLAALSQDNASQQQLQQPANQETAAPVLQDGVASPSSSVSSSPSKLPEDLGALKSKFMDDWDMDYRIEPDEILQQLAKEAMRNNRTSQKGGGKGKGDGNGRDTTDSEEPLKIECIKVKEEEGHAVVYYNPNWSPEARRRHLIGADNYDAEFDSESDISEDDEDGLPHLRKAYANYTNNELLALLTDKPDRYKRCVLHVESSRRMYAVNTDRSAHLQEIVISSRLRCGRGFNNDEVVVELLTADEDDTPAVSEQETQIQGQVVGILKRAINPRYRTFVCFVEQGNTGLMVPLNRGIPKMYNLETKQRLQKTKKGHVCVYTFTKDREIIFHHYEPINPNNQMEKLFLVRYLKWDAKFYSPLGIVVGVMPPGDSLESGMTVLNLEHSIPKKFKEKVKREVTQLYHAGYTLPESVYSSRLDCRESLIFTVDPAGSQDLDDALCIEELTEGNLLISIHITDVAHFIRRDSCMDMEAQARGTSFYPPEGDMVPMIPARLSTDLCSLLPMKDRLALSVLVTVDRDGTVTNVRIKRSVVRSKFKLQYEDVEEVLRGHDSSQLPIKLQMHLRLLHGIATRWRQDRLGSACLYQPLDADARETPQAHVMVEEMMICANRQVALVLLKKYSKCTPLRRQMAPDDVKLEEWRESQVVYARNSPVLTRPFLAPGSTCTCPGLCMCVPSAKLTSVQVRVDTWEQICTAARQRDLLQLTQLLVHPEHHPQLSVALLQLYTIQERSVYACSGDLTPGELWHYSLNLKPYTHFTSPIRRYMDLVVQRLLVAVLDGQPCPYSQVDMSAICQACTDAAVKAKRYESAAETLQQAVGLSNAADALYPVVQSVDETSLLLRFPTVRGMAPSSGNINLSLLQPAERPVVTEQGGCEGLDLMWLKRIYDAEKGATDAAKAVTVNNKKYVVEISAMHWQLLLQCLKEKNLDDIQAHLEEIRPDLNLSGSFGSDTVTMATSQKTSLEQYSNIRLRLEPCSVVKVQVVSEMHKGLLSPRIQLLRLTTNLDVCLEHRANPVQCFANMTAIRGTRTSYKDVEAYVSAWLPLLGMEAAHCASGNDESAVIRNVRVYWQEEVTPAGASYTGTFTLPVSFCKQRQIYFSMDSSGDLPPWAVDDTDAAHNSAEDAQKSVSKQSFDYLCVRYTDAVSSASSSSASGDHSSATPVSWVGHCYTLRVVLEKKRSGLIIQIQLNHSSVPIPRQLLSNTQTCTMEWIPKPLPSRRMESALWDLEKASNLAKAIALGKQPDELDPQLKASVRSVKKLKVPRLNPPNLRQEQAVTNALQQAFSLIQGPPGTGKTVTGVRLAYLFAELNKAVPLSSKDASKMPPQVLYCGPSNKSVDVVTEYLMSLQENQPKIVRVYSSRIEFSEFPIPRKVLMTKKSSNTADLVVSDKLKEVALHHIIRQPSCADSRTICLMDEFMRLHPDQVTDKQIEEYQNVVARAEMEVLKRAQIILSTCTASASPKIRHATRIRQLIIDECGMCMEPEAMIPIVSSKAQQVVLIGDHKQLRPIATQDTARRLGLDLSLFERYSDKAFMLTCQYRMHESICQFPSQNFYAGQLSVAKSDQSKPSMYKFWPNGRNRTFVFCHVIGQEETLQVATSDGNERSKMNQSEAVHAVRIGKLLVDRYHVKASDLVILSQYRAQCACIERGLREQGHTDIAVSTVVKSQGSEWDYVVISTVRSLPKSEIEVHPTNGWRRVNLGFITDENQINVAITRARKGLIIIGNKLLLRADPMWAKLLDYYKNNQKIVDAAEFMKLK